MSKKTAMVVLATLLAADSAYAQEQRTDLFMRIRKAMDLPTATQESRRLGVPESDLQSIFRTARDRRIPPDTIADLLFEENKAIRERGPIDNFGAFVQGRLDAGLRGRDLAAAIHAEHAARGIGKGKTLKQGSGGNPGAPGKSGSQGKPDDPGKSGSYGKPDDPGKSGSQGKPDDPGKSGSSGKPDDPGKSNEKKGGPR